jgi:multiple sugar transport system substrate-binding protein
MPRVSPSELASRRDALVTVPPAGGDPRPPRGGVDRRRFLALAGTLSGAVGVGMLAACGGAVSTSATVASGAATVTSVSSAAATASSSAPAATTSATTTSAPATSAAATSSAPALTASAATSSSASAAPAAAAAPPGAATIALTFWANGGNDDASYAAWVQRLADFNKANPQAKATMDAPADLDAKLATAVASGTPPSTAVQDRYTIAASSAKGLMQDISAMANQAGIKGADQQPWCWQEVAIKGKLYGLPYSTDARMIYMNVSHLQQAGVDTAPPKTLGDFTQIGQKLTLKQGGTLQRIGFIPWNDNWSPWGWGWLYGGDFYDAENNKATLDDPKIAASYDWAGTVASQVGYQAAQDFIKAHSGNLFTTQVQSSYITSTSFLIKVNGAGSSLAWTNWPPPPPQGVTKTSTWSGGFADVLPTGAKNPDQAFSLMTYLTDATMQTIQNKSGRLPTIKSVAADPYWNTVDPRTKAFIDMLPYSHSRPVTPQVNIMNDQLNQALTAVLSGKQTATQALKTANDFVNTAIQQNRV